MTKKLHLNKLYAHSFVSRSITALSQDAEVQKSLLSDWIDSLTSVYNLLKAGCCPYFYLSSHQFTALFRNADGAIQAILSPTSRGFREALKAEGLLVVMKQN